MSVELQPVGWIPLTPFTVTADDPAEPIPFDASGFRSVRFNFLNQGATDAYGAHEDDDGPTAVAIASGASEPTRTGPLSPASLPYHLWASPPVDVLVQPFGLVAGEQQPFSV